MAIGKTKQPLFKIFEIKYDIKKTKKIIKNLIFFFINSIMLLFLKF